MEYTQPKQGTALLDGASFRCLILLSPKGGLLTLHTFRSVGPASAEANALMHEYMLHVCGIGRRLIREFVHRKGKSTHYRERERERVVIYLEWWELFIEETKK